MEIVCAGTGDEVHLATRKAAVLRGQNAFGDLHLCDRVDAHDVDPVSAPVRAQRPYLGIVCRIRAVHRDTDSPLADAVQLQIPSVLRRSGSQTEKSRHITTREGQLTHLLSDESLLL